MKQGMTTTTIGIPRLLSINTLVIPSSVFRSVCTLQILRVGMTTTETVWNKEQKESKTSESFQIQNKQIIVLEWTQKKICKKLIQAIWQMTTAMKRKIAKHSKKLQKA